MWPNPQLPADFVTFTGEILNGRLYFSCSVSKKKREREREKDRSTFLGLPKVSKKQLNCMLFWGVTKNKNFLGIICIAT